MIDSRMKTASSSSVRPPSSSASKASSSSPPSAPRRRCACCVLIGCPPIFACKDLLLPLPKRRKWHGHQKQKCWEPRDPRADPHCSVGGAVAAGSHLHGAASAVDACGRRAASGPKNHQRVQNLHQEGKHGRAVNLQADPRRRPTRLHHRAWRETGHRVRWRHVSLKGPFKDPGTTHEQSSPCCRQTLWVRVHRGNL